MVKRIRSVGKRSWLATEEGIFRMLSESAGVERIVEGERRRKQSAKTQRKCYSILGRIESLSGIRWLHLALR